MEILLVRHGQAQFGQDNYDKLTDIGIQQSLALGDHFRRLSIYPDAIVSGTMVRHQETASHIVKRLGGSANMTELNGFNEYDFENLLSAFADQYPKYISNDENHRRAYAQNIRQALQFWMQGQLENVEESWTEFVERVSSSFQMVCEHRVKKVLIVSSGGPIAVILGQVLRLQNESIRSLSLQIKNTSISTLLYNRIDLTLDSFNCMGHLENSNSTDITYI